MVNGEIVAQGRQFALEDVEVITATVDVQDVRAYRAVLAKGSLENQSTSFERIQINFELSKDEVGAFKSLTPSKPAQYHTTQEEIAYGPACWLWDYLRRSKAAGFLLPLSGGLDSCATAITVYSMCRLVVEAIKAADEQVITDVRRIAVYSKNKLPATPEV